MKNPGRTKTDYVVDGSLAADLTTDAIDCIGYNRCTFEITVQPDDDAVADLYLQSSGGGSLWGNEEIEKMSTSDATAVTLSSGVITVNDPAAEAMVKFTVIDLPPRLRLFFDRTAGGADNVAVSYWLEQT